MPKFTALARRRSSPVISSGGRPKTWLAVWAWMSWPDWKAAIIFSSPAMWASRRSSIWE